MNSAARDRQVRSPVLRAAVRLFIGVLVATTSVRAQEFVTRATGSISVAASGAWPSSIAPAVGDFDGSGLLDVVAIDPAGGLYLFADVGVAGASALSAPTLLLAPGALGAYVPQQVVTANILGDAIADLVVVARDGQGGYLAAALASLPGGGFAPPVTLAVQTGGVVDGRVAALDLDGDGGDEVVFMVVTTIPLVGTFASGEILKSVGSGWGLIGVLPPFPFAVTVELSASDVNNDGFEDLLVTAFYYSGGPGLRTFFGLSSGVPTSSTVEIGTGGALRILAIGDVDNDGLTDVVVEAALTVFSPGNVVLPEIAILWGTVNSGLTPWSGRTSLGGPYGSMSAARGPAGLVADVDGDGVTDLLMHRSYGGYSNGGSVPTYGSQVHVRRGIGGRAFSAGWRSLFAIQQSTTVAYNFAAADFDGDGDPDVFGAPWFGQSSLALDNLALYGAGCGGAAGVPTLTSGAAYLGNSGYTLGLLGAAASAPALFGLSLAPALTAGCAPLIDLSAANLLLPDATGFGFGATDALGIATLPLPIPAIPALAGAKFYAQAAVLDPAGAFAGSLALTRGRAITLW